MYEMKLFNKGGFAPVVDSCVNCGRSDELTSFSIQEGGVLCKYCFSMDERAVQLPANLIKSLSIFLHVGLERVGNISMKKQNEQLLRTLFLEYYDVYGGYYLKSRKFLKQIDILQYISRFLLQKHDKFCIICHRCKERDKYVLYSFN